MHYKTSQYTLMKRFKNPAQIVMLYIVDIFEKEDQKTTAKATSTEKTNGKRECNWMQEQ